MQPRFNRRSYTLVTAPATEPVSLSEAKSYLRVDGTDDDTLITSLIATARRSVEDYIKRPLITQTRKLTMDGFADYEEGCINPGFEIGPTPFLVDGSQAIQLAWLPLQSITSIKTTDTANVQTTVSSGVYTVDAANGRVLLNDGQSWPTSLRARAAVEITFVCGYVAATDVPAPVKQAIIQYINAMFYNRQCAELPDGSKGLLAPYMSAEALGAVW